MDSIRAINQAMQPPAVRGRARHALRLEDPDAGDATGPQCQLVATFAVGGSDSYTMPWDNCAGWPQVPNPAANYYPDNIRVWVR